MAGGGLDKGDEKLCPDSVLLCPESVPLTTLGRDTTPAQLRSFRRRNSYSCYRASVCFTPQRRSAAQRMGNRHAARRLSLTFT